MRKKPAMTRGEWLTSLERTLRSRFDERWSVDAATGCWLWVAGKTWGYGIMSVKNRSVRAHRLAWTLYVGPIPEGLCVLHRCDVHACVNPAHLFLGTNADNSADMVAKNRANRKPRARYATGVDHWRSKHPELGARGEQHGNSVFTEADVVEIRRRVADKETYKSVAATYGVTPQAIYMVAKRINWAHVA